MIRALFAPLAMKVASGLIIALLLLLPVAFLKGREIERGKWERRMAQEAAAALASARKADAAALSTVKAGNASVAASEARAREAAAANPDDPLRAGLDSLRNEK